MWDKGKSVSVPGFLFFLVVSECVPKGFFLRVDKDVLI